MRYVNQNRLTMYDEKQCMPMITWWHGCLISSYKDLTLLPFGASIKERARLSSIFSSFSFYFVKNIWAIV